MQLFQKMITNVKLDVMWLMNPDCSLGERLHYLLRKYAAILGRKKHIRFLGGMFYYDNVYTPALLQAYPEEIRGLNKHIPLEQITSLLDIGANIGQFSYTLKKMFPHVTVYSFEPNMAVYPLLVKNVSNSESWKLFNKAIGTAREQKEFYFVEGKSMQGSFYKENSSINLAGGTHDITAVNVETVPLTKETLQQLAIPEQIDVVKIDVEGFEKEVLLGLKGVNWNYLYIELSTDRAGAMSIENCMELLESMFGTCEIIFQGKSDSGFSTDLIIKR